MKVSNFISNRLFSFSRDNVSSTAVRLTVASIAISMIVMIISVAVVIGFKNGISEKVIGFAAPIQISALDLNQSAEETPFQLDSALAKCLDDDENIAHYQAVANKAGIIKTDEEIQGVMLKGVGTDYDWTYFSNRIVEGRLPIITDTARSTEVLVSKVLAGKLKLAVGDDLRMWFVDKDMQTRGRKFTVAGIYQTGLYEYDERIVIGDIAQIRRLNSWGDNDCGKVEVLIDRNADIQQVNEKLYYNLPVTLTSTTVMESNPQIFDWLALLDTNVVLIIVLMLLVSGITAISMILILILERTSTIGLLKAMGADNRLIRRIFLRRAILLVIEGMVIGNVVGLLFCYVQSVTGFVTLPAETYYLSAVPIELNPLYIVMLNVATFVFITLTLFIPTMVISRVNPVKSIRFE